MDYDDIAAVYLVPMKDPVSAPSVPHTPARRLRDALEPIATQGWWGRSVNARMKALGLDFFQGYVWGRAASLGEPSAAVVAATFGVFEPNFIGAVYSSAVGVASRFDVLAARDLGASEGMMTLIGASTAHVTSPLLDALHALDGTARPLFAGLRSLDLPEDPLGRLWRAAELVREHRGDGHLAACIAAGLDPVTMNVLTELWLEFPLGAYSGTRGYSPEQLEVAVEGLRRRGWMDNDGLTDAGRAGRLAIEDATDASQSDLVKRLGGRLNDIVTDTSKWSDQLVKAGGFPSDPRKRAAG
jgi:hypothetical protein